MSVGHTRAMANTAQPAPAPRLVLGYVRVSTDKQAGKGVSLEAQAERITAMATLQELTVADILIDAGASAGSLNRPALAQLLWSMPGRSRP
jgi:DNA invertase Pin-like site-specific DNA recombinase